MNHQSPQASESSTSNPSPAFKIYAQYCHRLSPTIKKWCPMRIIDVLSLTPSGQFSNNNEIYQYKTHPIAYLRVLGVIVAIESYGSRTIYTLDDGSNSCLNFCALRPPPSNPSLHKPRLKPHAPLNKHGIPDPTIDHPSVPWTQLHEGLTVKILGRMSSYAGLPQISVVKIELLRCTDAEVKWWEAARVFKQGVLDVPWLLTEREERRCRRAEEMGAKRAGEKVRKAGRGEKGWTRTGTERRRGGLEARDTKNEPALALRRQAIAQTVAMARAEGKYDQLGL